MPAGVDSWTLQTLGDVVLHSPIVRLQDIVVPVAIPKAEWAEFGSVAVTLVPTDGRRLTIERQRLLEYVQRHLLPGQRVHWTGPELIYVRYQGEVRKVAFPTGSQVSPTGGTPNMVRKIPSTKTVQQTGLSASAHRSTAQEPARQTAFPSKPAGPGGPALGDSPAGGREQSEAAGLPAQEVERLSRLIEATLRSEWPEIAEAFDFNVDPNDAGLRKLRSIRRIDTLRLSEPLRSGSQLVQIEAATLDAAVISRVTLYADPRPEGLFVRNNIRRGERIHRHDLERRRLTGNPVTDGLVEDMDQVVGMEVRTSLSPHRPIRRDDIRPPIVIRRGDLVEVRVVGGGIIVRSNAKAMDDASVGELVEIETEHPRKRLMASVVQSGQVEILTRAPNLGQ